MCRLPGILGLLGLFFLVVAPVAAQNRGPQAATKENLDLPFDAFGNSEDEEEAPEVVYFYGQQYEGDGIFFCLDRSSSTCNGELAIEKREAIRTVSQFSRRVEFAVVFYDQRVISWPTTGRPAEASAGQKAGAIGFLSTIQCGRGTCVREGLVKCLQYADRSSAKRNVIIYLGDGGTTCPGHDRTQYAASTLTTVAAQNHKRHQINAICVGTEVNGDDERFCRQLAAQNHGKFSFVQR